MYIYIIIIHNNLIKINNINGLIHVDDNLVV